MSDYKGIPFDGGMDSPTGAGAQHIVETCKAIVDWGEDMSVPGTLADNTAAPCIRWDSRVLVDSNAAEVLNWENYFQIDGAGAPAINWDQRRLIDGNGNDSIEWSTRALKDSAATQSLDYGGRLAKNSIGAPCIDWENCLLQDPSTGNTNVDWVNNNLNDQAGDTVFTWATGIGFFGTASQTQKTGGAATAGAVYTGTEQGMINRMYSALRAYGLLS